MRKTSASTAGIFNPRVFVVFLLCSAAAWLTLLSFASTPSQGTITDTSTTQTYTAGPFFEANQSPVGLGQVDTGPRCDTGFPCDQYTLHIQLPANYGTSHCFPVVRVTAAWTDTGTGQSDYDLYIYSGANPTIDGNHPADFQSATGNDPEIAYIGGIPMDGQVHDYTIVIVPFQPTGETLTVKAELLPGPAPGSIACGAPAFGSADSTAPGKPRYQVFEAPSPDADVGNGEFNIGFNPHTGRIMTMNSGPIWRITPPEIQSPAKPECCEGLWENKSTITANIGLDPILWTDQLTGRTFVSNSTAGANAVYAYTDSDGDPSTTQPTGWTEFGIAAPNGGADHETIGSGPYPAPLNIVLSTPQNQGHAVYYCSQDIVGPASCYRSDTLGVSWGPSTLAYTGQGLTEANPPVPGGACGGLHGHIHVAPDGTAWLPVNQCGGLQGGVFSTDGGTTWVQFLVPNAFSQQQGADPSIAIDANNTIYYAYVKNEPVANPTTDPPEGHAHVAVGNRVGNSITWVNDIDIGADHSIRNAAEIEAVGGSAGRAAVGFLGSDRPGDYQANNFPGKWYAFISTTYNGGQTWTTVNSTPNDPVQSMTGIWQQGGSRLDRNLLDFNEITIDDKGRVLYGFSDGCVTPGCIAGTAPNDFVANLRVARQSGGKTLLASYDSQTDLPGQAARAPKPPCLSGVRDTSTSHLTWKAPDNGGAAITQYQIFRGTSPGGEGATPIGTSTSNKFDDTSADSSVTHYYYTVKAINSAGTSNTSNELDLPISASLLETPCALPGLTILQDGTGDVGPDGTAADDVQWLAIGEPYALAPDKIVFTLKVADLSTLPPNTEWPINFNAPDGNNYTAQMTTAPSDGASNVTPQFQVYNTNSLTGGLLMPADPASNFTPDGTITIVVPRSLIGNPAVGSSLNNFLVRITISDGLGGGLTPDNMPNSLNPAGSYTIVGNAACAPNTAPVAVLKAYPVGQPSQPPNGAPPFAVTLDGSGSSDPDSGDTVASYTFSFGDGSQPVTQTSAMINHTYTTAGQYSATLKVTDSRGKVSSNTGLVNIVVNTPPTAALSASPTSGKAPLSVSFNASASSDPDAGDTIASYSFNFGDGSATVTQSTATVSHTYSSKGTYTARVAVQDSRGATSTNAATQSISVMGGGKATPTPTPTPSPTATPSPSPSPTATPSPTPTPTPRPTPRRSPH
jgi:PKD domain